MNAAAILAAREAIERYAYATPDGICESNHEYNAALDALCAAAADVPPPLGWPHRDEVAGAIYDATGPDVSHVAAELAADAANSIYSKFAPPVSPAPERTPARFERLVDPLTEREIRDAFAIDEDHWRASHEETHRRIVAERFEYIQNYGKDDADVRRIVLQRATAAPLPQPDTEKRNG